MANILIVDDEPNIVDVLKEYAEYNGMSVDSASNGMEALEKVEKNHYDCVVLDIMMPYLDGYDTIKSVKEIASTPVIMISAKNEEYDKLKGFELGADDYIVKPFSPKEVMARIKALLKRSIGYVDTYIVENIKIDTIGRQIYIDDVALKLTKKEYDLFMVLVNNKGVVLSRDRLLAEVWGFDYNRDYRTVDTHIKLLRKHLQSLSKYIKTIRGVGYKFEIN